jgi:hypothetical protein
MVTVATFVPAGETLPVAFRKVSWTVSEPSTSESNFAVKVNVLSPSLHQPS